MKAEIGVRIVYFTRSYSRLPFDRDRSPLGERALTLPTAKYRRPGGNPSTHRAVIALPGSRNLDAAGRLVLGRAMLTAISPIGGKQ